MRELKPAKVSKEPSLLNETYGMEGREGVADFRYTKETGNVMFYPKDGFSPYRICLSKDVIELR